MKTLIIVISFMFVFVIGWFIIYESIENHTNQFVHTLDNISQNIQNQKWASVSIEFDKMKKNWNKIRKILTILLDHHEIDNIDLSMAKAEKYIQTKNRPLSQGEIEVLKQLFLIVKESEELTLTNIL